MEGVSATAQSRLIYNLARQTLRTTHTHTSFQTKQVPPLTTGAGCPKNRFSPQSTSPPLSFPISPPRRVWHGSRPFRGAAKGGAKGSLRVAPPPQPATLAGGGLERQKPERRIGAIIFAWGVGDSHNHRSQLFVLCWPLTLSCYVADLQ